MVYLVEGTLRASWLRPTQIAAPLLPSASHLKTSHPEPLLIPTPFYLNYIHLINFACETIVYFIFISKWSSFFFRYEEPTLHATLFLKSRTNYKKNIINGIKIHLNSFRNYTQTHIQAHMKVLNSSFKSCFFNLTHTQI